jgi:hypothetical protein
VRLSNFGRKKQVLSMPCMAYPYAQRVGCAKPPPEATAFRLRNHKRGRILRSCLGVIYNKNQGFAGLESPAWGARNKVFESLRPDHICEENQPVSGVIPFFISGLRKTRTTNRRFR